MQLCENTQDIKLSKNTPLSFVPNFTFKEGAKKGSGILFGAVLSSVCTVTIVIVQYYYYYYETYKAENYNKIYKIH